MNNTVVFPQVVGYSERAAKSSGAGRMLSHPDPAPNPTDVLNGTSPEGLMQS